MNIELATADDYEAICAVLAEGDAILAARVPDVFSPKRGPARPREFLVERIKGPESAIFVARESAAVVGVVETVMKAPIDRDGHVRRRVALIDNIVVRASHRQRGIGAQLVSRAESWALERGADVTELNVWSFNESARRLYERLGYVAQTVRMQRVVRP
jgi:ribosomal protein S18 acetylase RimI-like enzyme